jgi:hypothetical protein
MKTLSSIVTGLMLSFGISCSSSVDVKKNVNMYAYDDRGEYIVIGKIPPRLSEIECIDDEIYSTNLSEFTSFAVSDNVGVKNALKHEKIGQAGNLYIYSFEDAATNGEIDRIIEGVREEFGKMGVEFNSINHIRHYIDLKHDDIMFFLMDEKYFKNSHIGEFGINLNVGALFDFYGNIDDVKISLDQEREDEFRKITKVHYDSLTLANNVGFVIVKDDGRGVDRVIHEVGHAVGAAHPTFMEVRHYRDGMVIHYLKTLNVEKSFMGFLNGDGDVDYCMTNIDRNNVGGFLNNVDKLKRDQIYQQIGEEEQKRVMLRLRGFFNKVARVD